ncbi:MAG: hypothetical protein ACI4LP_00120 [Anaerovoracaceae bacterium]
MTKAEAKKGFTNYLNAEHINYTVLNETGQIASLDELDTIYLSCNIEDVIGGRIETSVRFMEEYCYCQSYYCQPVAKTEEKAIKAARMCNYMNLHLHWDCNSLFEHNYFLNEEDGDIFNGFLIRYELLDEYFQEALDHILNFSVQQIADVCIPIIFHLEGKYSYEDFKEYLRFQISGK